MELRCRTLVWLVPMGSTPVPPALSVRGQEIIAFCTLTGDVRLDRMMAKVATEQGTSPVVKAPTSTMTEATGLDKYQFLYIQPSMLRMDGNPGPREPQDMRQASRQIPDSHGGDSDLPREHLGPIFSDTPHGHSSGAGPVANAAPSRCGSPDCAADRP